MYGQRRPRPLLNGDTCGLRERSRFFRLQDTPRVRTGLTEPWKDKTDRADTAGKRQRGERCRGATSSALFRQIKCPRYRGGLLAGRTPDASKLRPKAKRNMALLMPRPKGELDAFFAYPAVAITSVFAGIVSSPRRANTRNRKRGLVRSTRSCRKNASSGPLRVAVSDMPERASSRKVRQTTLPSAALARISCSRSSMVKPQ